MDNLFKERKNRLDVFRKWRKKPIPKAKEIPDHVFMSCSHCHTSVAMMDLVSNHYVCPNVIIHLKFLPEKEFVN